jgi:hypothetical protein
VTLRAKGELASYTVLLSTAVSQSELSLVLLQLSGCNLRLQLVQFHHATE